MRNTSTPTKYCCRFDGRPSSPSIWLVCRVDGCDCWVKQRGSSQKGMNCKNRIFRTEYHVGLEHSIHALVGKAVDVQNTQSVALWVDQPKMRHRSRSIQHRTGTSTASQDKQPMSKRRGVIDIGADEVNVQSLPRAPSDQTEPMAEGRRSRGTS